MQCPTCNTERQPNLECQSCCEHTEVQALCPQCGQSDFNFEQHLCNTCGFSEDTLDYYCTKCEKNLISDMGSIQLLIDNLPSNERSKLSDGHHTFEELYEFRVLYHAIAFNNLCLKYDIHKSFRHHDGELCFGGGWFIVVAMTPEGQVSNHYKNKYWDYFKIPEAPKAIYEFDGHNAQDVISRLKSII